MCISADPEPVYYHPLGKCFPNRDLSSKINKLAKGLEESHTDLLWKEFGTRRAELA